MTATAAKQHGNKVIVEAKEMSFFTGTDDSQNQKKLLCLCLEQNQMV